MKSSALLAAAMILLGSAPVAALAAATEAGGEPPTLGIAGISATTGEDEPRILFILPWQPPSLPRRPRAELEDTAPGLEQPLDPEAVERLRQFRNTLDPMSLDPRGIQP